MPTFPKLEVIGLQQVMVSWTVSEGPQTFRSQSRRIWVCSAAWWFGFTGESNFNPWDTARCLGSKFLSGVSLFPNDPEELMLPIGSCSLLPPPHQEQLQHVTCFYFVLWAWLNTHNHRSIGNLCSWASEMLYAYDTARTGADMYCEHILCSFAHLIVPLDIIYKHKFKDYIIKNFNTSM